MLIEINLAPGASSAKLGGRKLSGLALPAMPSLGGSARAAGGGLAALLVLGSVAFGYLQLGARHSALEAQIQQEVTDSTRYAATIELIRTLQAREDTIRQKIGVIRDVDTRRYVWPHLLDEISLAVPAFTWLTEINSSQAADSLQTGPVFSIQGSAGSTQALTRFMKNLEASPFVRDVMLITTEQEVVEGRAIQKFTLEARYRTPEPDVVQTIPILVLD